MMNLRNKSIKKKRAKKMTRVNWVNLPNVDHKTMINLQKMNQNKL